MRQKKRNKSLQREVASAMFAAAANHHHHHHYHHGKVQLQLHEAAIIAFISSEHYLHTDASVNNCKRKQPAQLRAPTIAGSSTLPKKVFKFDHNHHAKVSFVLSLVSACL